MERIRLGLFGVGISRSQAPRLHVLAGQLSGLEVSYDLFDLNDLGHESIEKALKRTANEEFRGVNVTHPIKEKVARLVAVPNEAMRQVGAVNTIRFQDNTAYNTDYSGFIKAFRAKFGSVKAGNVLMLGAGGVGKAVAFALKEIDSATNLFIVDTDLAKAETLGAELAKVNLKTSAHKPSDLPDLVNVDGLINCTPLGMYQYPGCALPKSLFGGQSWAFDAVYTPLETEFLLNAKEAKLDVLSGYELFFCQGIDAFEIFTGHRVDEDALRKVLS